MLGYFGATRWLSDIAAKAFPVKGRSSIWAVLLLYSSLTKLAYVLVLLLARSFAQEAR